MRDLKRRIRNALFVALVLGAVAVLLPGAGSAGGPSHTEPGIEQWVETPEAQVRTAAGECDDQPGKRCYQLCVTINGETTLHDTWECF